MPRLQKRRLWLIAAAVAGAAVFLIPHTSLLSSLLDISIDSAIHRTAAFAQASSAFQNSAAAKQLLGDSLQTSRPAKGDLRERGSWGRAIFNFPVSGSHAKGLLYVKATMQNHLWRIEELAIRLDGQSEWHELEDVAPAGAPSIISSIPPITAHRNGSGIPIHRILRRRETISASPVI